MKNVCVCAHGVTRALSPQSKPKGGGNLFLDRNLKAGKTKVRGCMRLPPPAPPRCLPAPLLGGKLVCCEFLEWYLFRVSLSFSLTFGTLTLVLLYLCKQTSNIPWFINSPNTTSYIPASLRLE